MMNKIVKIFSLLLFMASGFVSAHAELEASTPAKNAILMESPKKLELTFKAEVRVIRVVIKKVNGEKVSFGFKFSSENKLSYQWELPNLISGDYEVDWTAMGKDGHKMKSHFHFTIH